MTALDEFGFEADPTPLALDLMRTVLSDDAEVPLDLRLQFVVSLVRSGENDEDGSTELGAWMRRALQD